MADVSIEKLASLTGTENKAGIETLNASMNFSQRIWKYAMASCSVTNIFRSNLQFEIDLNWTISLEPSYRNIADKTSIYSKPCVIELVNGGKIETKAVRFLFRIIKGSLKFVN